MPEVYHPPEFNRLEVWYYEGDLTTAIVKIDHRSYTDPAYRHYMGGIVSCTCPSDLVQEEDGSLAVNITPLTDYRQAQAFVAQHWEARKAWIEFI